MFRKKNQKSLSIIAALLTAVLVVGACAARGSATPAPSGASAGTAPTQITVFMQESGQNWPDGFDRLNNWQMDRIQELANIEITEFIVPAYSDTETKLNLLLASGNIPDFIGRAYDSNNLNKYADEGAFADLTDLFTTKEFLMKEYNETMINALKRPNGRIYFIKSMPLNDDYPALYIRADLLDKAGWNKPLPTTLDEYIDAMRAIKAWDPDSLPYTFRGTDWWYQQWFIFQPFDTYNYGFDWKERLDRYVNQWEGDGIIRAAEFGNLLYTEKLLDNEFITNNGADVNQKRLRDNCFIWAQNRGGMITRMETIAADGQGEARFYPVPMPIADGIEGYTAFKTAPNIFGPCDMGISAKCNQEKFDACVRLVETFFSEEIEEQSIYGREGIEFTRGADGTRIPILPTIIDTSYREWISLYYRTNTAEIIDFAAYVAIMLNTENGVPEADLNEYYKEFARNAQYIQDNYLAKLPYTPLNFISTQRPDDIANMITDCNQLQNSLIAKVIMGEMSIAEFTTARDEILVKYQPVVDWYNNEIDAIRGTY